MKGWVVNGAAQPLIWVIWAAKTAHPCQWMLWVGVLGGGLAKLLEIYDSSPLQGIIDANAFCHAATILLTCILWSLLGTMQSFELPISLRRPSSPLED